MESSLQKPAPRIPLKLQVEYRKSYARRADNGQLRNISLTGAFLEHSNPELQANEKVSLTFTVSGRTRTVVAEIVWTTEFGSGVRFMPDNNRDVQIVDDIMYFVQNRRDTRRTVLDDIFKKVS